MKRWLFLLFLACRGDDEAPVYTPPETAFSLRGNVRIAASNIALQSLAIGRLNIRLYRSVGEGYCLEPAATLIADVVHAVPEPNIALLLDQGQPYYFSVIEAPGLTFPLTVYPVADWQTTQVRDNPCEQDIVAGFDHYNARGVFRPGQASACCDLIPSGIVIDNKGVIVEGVDIELTVRNKSGDTCADPTRPFDRCQFEGCEGALGERAPLVLQSACD